MRKFSFTEVMYIVSLLLFFITILLIKSTAFKIYIIAAIIIYWAGYIGGYSAPRKYRAEKLEEQ